MTSSTNAWWQGELDPDETLLWHASPKPSLIPPQHARIYIPLGLLLCLALPLVLLRSGAEDNLWLLAGGLGLLAFGLLTDQFLRKRRVYAVTSRRVWEFNRKSTPNSLQIDTSLRFKRGPHSVNFEGRLNFALQNLTDPDAAIRALQQAQKAAG
jgi:hypothetical protein